MSTESDRLRELKRQKRLLEEHLAWLNEEIDRETISSSPSSSPSSDRLSEAFAADRPVQESIELESKPQEQVAADLYSELGPDTTNAAADTKRGCMLIAAAAFAALAGLVAYVMFWY